jgi:hypothetical protein
MPKWLALALCGLGAAMVAVALRQSGRGRETRDWTRTVGRVVVSRVEKLGEADEQRCERYRFRIRYAYEARGASHASEQVWIGSEAAAEYDDEGAPRRWTERFPEGGEVPVWFDPAEPGRAVLVPGVPRAQIASLVIAGLALAGIGLFSLVRAASR